MSCEPLPTHTLNIFLSGFCNLARPYIVVSAGLSLEGGSKGNPRFELTAGVAYCICKLVRGQMLGLNEVRIILYKALLYFWKMRQVSSRET